jgi:tRNA threonylcarbamoyladenosine biosynthesis protein TsaB
MIEPFLGNNYDLIVPLIDARRMEVYTAVYDGKTGEEISATEAKILDEILLKNLKTKSNICRRRS